MATDFDAWQKYPNHRQWFNKMNIAEMFGYKHGPGGVPVPTAGTYVVRPIMNLYGMGAGASIQHLTPDDAETVPPGYFWCERFKGEQLSYELTWNLRQGWLPTSVWQADRTKDNLSLLNRWIRVDRQINLRREFDALWDCGSINVETVGGNVIEVHLRSTPDPTDCNELVPVWRHNVEHLTAALSDTHTFVESPDYVYGTDLVRLGFFCK